MKKIKKQVGFALIEVMLAALVMTIGGVAFMKLQQMGLQYSFNNYARTQGVVFAEDFIEQLRSNVGLLKSASVSGTVIRGEISKTETVPSTQVNCSSESNTASCSASLLALQKYLISQQMSAIASDSKLCYLERAAGTGHLRITYLWQDNSKKGKSASTTCPATFADNSLDLNNSVTIYAQL